MTQKSSRVSSERWLVSYADFITLLFAFFVVMYALSIESGDKYKVLSDSINEAFASSFTSIDPITLKKVLKYLSDLQGSKGNVIDKITNEPDISLVDLDTFNPKAFFTEFEEKFQGIIKDGKIKFRESDLWFEIELESNLLFSTGGAFLRGEAEIILKDLADIFNKIENSIVVEGFTDNVPIANNLYPSNWELSADRAARVARALVSNKVDPKRISTIGYGENFPKDTNLTVEGRKNNRRVIILLEKNNPRRDYLLKHMYIDKNKGNRNSDLIVTPQSDFQVRLQESDNNQKTLPNPKNDVKEEVLSAEGDKESNIDNKAVETKK